MDTLRIGLIDEVLLRRELIKTALVSEGIEVTAFATVTECVEAELDTEVLVYLPNLSAVAQTKRILEAIAALERHGLPVVLVASADPHREAKTIRELLSNGVKGYIAMGTADVPTAIAALHYVRNGGIYAPVDNILGPKKPQAVELPLTDRQLDVLRKLRQGQPNKIIAYELGMSESTVKVHVRSIMRRLGAINRTQAVYYAETHNIAA